MKARPAVEDGFATVWTVVAMAIVVLVAGACVVIGAATLDRHRAAAAADAAALAAAVASIQGSTAACAAAAAVAARDGATMASCRLDGAVAEVSVRVALPGVLARFGSASGRSRAGPASETMRGTVGVRDSSALQSTSDTPEIPDKERFRMAA